MRRFLPLSLGALIIISIPLIAFSLVQASPGPGAPAHWSAARNISNSLVDTSGPRIAAQGNGILHVIWIEVLSPTVETGNLLYKKSEDQGSSWGDTEQVTSEEKSWPGDVTLGSDGTAHAVWIEYESFANYSVKYANSGDWVASTSTVATPAFQQEPAIAVSNDYVHVAWAREIVNLSPFYSRKPLSGGAWTAPAPIATTDPTSLSPDIALDSEGNVHAVWQENHDQSPIYSSIYYSRETYGGEIGWSPVVTVSQSVTKCTTPTIAVGSDDYVHIVWGQRIGRDEQYVYYANFPYTDTSSITPVQVFTEAIGVSTEAPTYLYPKVAIRGVDEVHVVWHGKGQITDQIWHAVSEDKGSSWSSPIQISREAARQGVGPDIALAGEIEHVVWQGKDQAGKYQVMYSRGFPYAIRLPMITKSYPGG